MSSTRTPTTERLAIGHPTQEMLPQRKEKGKPNRVFLRGLRIFCEMPRRGTLQCDSARVSFGLCQTLRDRTGKQCGKLRLPGVC